MMCVTPNHVTDGVGGVVGVDRASFSRRYSTSDVERRKDNNFKGKLFDVLFSEHKQDPGKE